MNKIYVIKVMNELAHRGDSRIVGWSFDPKKAEDLLHAFGSECRWQFALIEELSEGLHPESTVIDWFTFDWNDNDWYAIIPKADDFTRCINHTIG